MNIPPIHFISAAQEGHEPLFKHKYPPINEAIAVMPSRRTHIAVLASNEVLGLSQYENYCNYIAMV